MANKKSVAFCEAGSWYHRIKVLQKDGTTKYSKRGGFATAKEAEASYHKYEGEYKLPRPYKSNSHDCYSNLLLF